MSILKNAWNETHPLAKTIIVVGSIATLGFVVYKSWSGIKTYVQSILGKTDEKKELGDLASQGVKPTLTDTENNGMISSIVNALSGWTEDEQAVKSQLKKIQNKADYLKFNLNWGVQKICDGVGLCDTYDFPSALQEFIPEEIQNINIDFSSRGVGVTI